MAPDRAGCPLSGQSLARRWAPTPTDPRAAASPALDAVARPLLFQRPEVNTGGSPEVPEGLWYTDRPGAKHNNCLESCAYRCKVRR